MTTDQSPPAQASDEPMRSAFWKFIATLPTPVQDNISTSEARGESITAKAFESGYRAALAKARATADVEQFVQVGRCISKAGDRVIIATAISTEWAARIIAATKGAKP